MKATWYNDGSWKGLYPEEASIPLCRTFRSGGLSRKEYSYCFPVSAGRRQFHRLSETKFCREKWISMGHTKLHSKIEQGDQEDSDGGVL